MRYSCDGLAIGSGFNITACINVKIAVVAPIPSARVVIVASVNTGDWRICGIEYRTSAFRFKQPSTHFFIRIPLANPWFLAMSLKRLRRPAQTKLKRECLRPSSDKIVRKLTLACDPMEFRAARDSEDGNCLKQEWRQQNDGMLAGHGDR
jgi:hypothetical protein